MKIAKLDHIDLHYRVDGNPNGRPVVFANSLGTDLRLWDAVLPLLPQGNCKNNGTPIWVPVNAIM